MFDFINMSIQVSFIYGHCRAYLLIHKSIFINEIRNN